MKYLGYIAITGWCIVALWWLLAPIFHKEVPYLYEVLEYKNGDTVQNLETYLKGARVYVDGELKWQFTCQENLLDISREYSDIK